MAIGCRALPDSMVETTYVVRSLMGRLFNELVTMGTGLGLKDTQCGFKAFRTPVARLLFHLVRIDRFAFDVEVLARARRLGLTITEVPVHWKHVEGSTVHPLHDSFTMLADVYRSRRGLLAGPPVPALVGPARTLGSRLPRDLAARVVAACSPRPSTAAPVPVVTDGRGRHRAAGPGRPGRCAARPTPHCVERLAPLDVTRRALDLDGLTRPRTPGRPPRPGAAVT